MTKTNFHSAGMLVFVASSSLLVGYWMGSTGSTSSASSRSGLNTMTVVRQKDNVMNENPTTDSAVQRGYPSSLGEDEDAVTALGIGNDLRFLGSHARRWPCKFWVYDILN